MSIEQYIRKAEEFLRRATDATDLRERGVQIEQAMYWHSLAMAARESRPVYDVRVDADEDVRLASD